MQVDMEVSQRPWIAAVKLALVVSIIAALIAVGVSSFGNVPNVAIVLPVIVVAFAASWVQTGRVRESVATQPLRTHRRAVPIGRHPAFRATIVA